MTDTQHSLQWSAFKPRAIASKPLSLTNFDNPLPFATINEDNDKRKWGNPEDIDDGDRKKQHLNGARSPSSDGHSTDKGSVNDIHTTTSEAKIRRKAQNRAAQRAFRERKEKYVQELEGKIKQMEAAHRVEKDRLLETNQNLMSLIQKLEAEITDLKSNSPTAAIEENADHSMTDYSGSPHSLSPGGENDASSVDPIAASRENSGSTKHGSRTQRTLGSRYCGTSCRTTKDGISFCEKLKEEVCSSAFERLLSENIFDNSGVVNSYIEPVPIVTSPINRERKFSAFQKNFLESDSNSECDEYDLSSGTSEAFKHEPHPDTLQAGQQFITCSQVWERLCEHPQFEEFDIEEVCAQLKTKAKCSGSGPVLEENELQEVLEALEAKLARDSSP